MGTDAGVPPIPLKGVDSGGLQQNSYPNRRRSSVTELPSGSRAHLNNAGLSSGYLSAQSTTPIQNSNISLNALLQRLDGMQLQPAPESGSPGTSPPSSQSRRRKSCVDMPESRGGRVSPPTPSSRSAQIPSNPDQSRGQMVAQQADGVVGTLLEQLTNLVRRRELEYRIYVTACCGGATVTLEMLKAAAAAGELTLNSTSFDGMWDEGWSDQEIEAECPTGLVTMGQRQPTAHAVAETAGLPDQVSQVLNESDHEAEVRANQPEQDSKRYIRDQLCSAFDADRAGNELDGAEVSARVCTARLSRIAFTYQLLESLAPDMLRRAPSSLRLPRSQRQEWSQYASLARECLLGSNPESRVLFNYVVEGAAKQQIDRIQCRPRPRASSCGSRTHPRLHPGPTRVPRRSDMQEVRYAQSPRAIMSAAERIEIELAGGYRPPPEMLPLPDDPVNPARAELHDVMHLRGQSTITTRDQWQTTGHSVSPVQPQEDEQPILQPQCGPPCGPIQQVDQEAIERSRRQVQRILGRGQAASHSRDKPLHISPVAVPVSRRQVPSLEICDQEDYTVLVHAPVNRSP